MRRLTTLLTAGLICLSAACAARYQNVRIPPRVDLSAHEIIAVVQFDSSNKGKLGPLATRRFTDLARRDQGMVRMLDVNLEPGRRNGDGYRELGRSHGAKTVLVGRLDVSDVRPELSISKALQSGSLRASVNAILTVDLIETDTGASIWSASARATRTIGGVHVIHGHDVAFDAADPDEAYGELIDSLVSQATTDLRASWVREPIAR